MLLYKAVELKEQGKTMEEIHEWIEANKLRVCHIITVDDLNHLHRGGRVSKATAVLGSMVKIKPMLCMNREGKLVVTRKERGCKKSLMSLIASMEKQMQGDDNDIIMIVHGDCEEDAEFVRQQVEERFGIKKFMINGLGAVIGSHTGPGMVAVLFMGNRK